MWWKVTGKAYDDDGDPFDIDEHLEESDKEKAIQKALWRTEFQICKNEEQPATFDWLTPFEEEPLTVRLSVPPRLLHDADVLALIQERDELLERVDYLEDATSIISQELMAYKYDPAEEFEPEF